MKTKIILLLALVTVLSIGLSTPARADGPDDGLSPQTDPLPGKGFRPGAYNGLTMHMFFDFSPSKKKSLGLQSVEFTNTAPPPSIARPVHWLARGLSFSNRCEALIGLPNPRVVRYGEPLPGRTTIIASPTTSQESWYLRDGDGHPLYVDMAVTPGLAEIEIMNEEYETLGFFDVTDHIDTYCDGDPDNPICQQRNNHLVELTDPADIDLIPGTSVYDFGKFPDQEQIGKLAGGDIVLENANGNPLISTDLETSDIAGAVFRVVAPGKEASGRTVAHNIHDGDGKGGYVKIILSEPVSGIAANFGIVSKEHIDGKPGPDRELIAGMEKAYLESNEQILRRLAPQVHYDQPVDATIQAYDEKGVLINKSLFTVSPLPGLHVFAGILLPFKSAQVFQIEFRSDNYEEIIDDLHIIPANVKKVASNNFLRSEQQPCPGISAMRVGPVGEFQSEPTRIPKKSGEQTQPTSVPSVTTELKPTLVSGSVVPPAIKPTVSAIPTVSPPAIGGGTLCQTGASGGPIGAGGIGLLLLPAVFVLRKININRS